jgi:uncharacterized protein (TIGR02300 family)
VAKPELGTKRLCGACGAKFYDLNKSPILCPKCGTAFEVLLPRARPDAAAARPAVAAKEPELETAETPEAEFVSLEEADAEAQGKSKVTAEASDVEADEDIDTGDESLDDAAFIQEEEEGDADVTDIIGEGIEKEEET